MNDWARKFKVLSINFTVTVLLIVVFELGALAWLKFNSINVMGHKKPLNNLRYDYLDPLVGWVSGPDQVLSESLKWVDGLVVLGKESAAFKVLVLGGSTTDFFVDLDNWPKTLYKKLLDHGVDVVIYNGATGGHNSDQELLRLIRDGLSLKPDLILSYSGVNETSGPTVGGYRFAFNYEEDIYRYYSTSWINGLLPSLSTLFMSFQNEWSINPHQWKFNRGWPDKKTAAQAWLANQKSMSLLARENGIQYLGFLQPHLGVPGYEKSKREKEIASNPLIEGFLNDYKNMYSELRKSLVDNEFIVDVSKTLNSMSDVYRDDCHVLPQANQTIGESIFQALRRRKLLSADAE